MATESPSQLAREAKIATVLLEKELRFLQQNLANAELSKHRERTAVLENQVAQLIALMEEHKPTRADLQ